MSDQEKSAEQKSEETDGEELLQEASNAVAKKYGWGEKSASQEGAGDARTLYAVWIRKNWPCDAVNETAFEITLNTMWEKEKDLVEFIYSQALSSRKPITVEDVWPAENEYRDMADPDEVADMLRTRVAKKLEEIQK